MIMKSQLGHSIVLQRGQAVVIGDEQAFFRRDGSGRWRYLFDLPGQYQSAHVLRNNRTGAATSSGRAWNFQSGGR